MQIGKLTREEREMVLLMRQIRQETLAPLALVPQHDVDDMTLWQAQTEVGWKLMHKGFDDMIKQTGVCPRDICECREDDCTPEKCQGFCLRFLTDEEEEQCRKRANLHAVVEKTNFKKATDGERRAEDGRGSGGCGGSPETGSLGSGAE